MKKSLIAILFCLQAVAYGQSKYWVYFTDKKGVEFDPYTFFDEKAIDRRIKNNIPLIDTTDFPVNENYIAAVTQLCDSVSYATRWFNAIAVYGNEAQMELIAHLPFVKEIEAMDEYRVQLARRIELEDFNAGQMNLLVSQTKRMQIDKFRKMNINGKGVRVAIIDAGFTGFKECEALRHTVGREYVKDTYDFIKKDKNVYHGHSHGTMVSSCVAGKIDSVQLGFAPNVEFLLARTEKGFSDRLKEEELWLAAVEWADRNGADIINSSLGYTSSRYFRKDMNGKAGLISRAATMAARKGILVVSSAGNEGDSEWKVVAAPGDADSVLTVGAISPWTGIQASWSSYGPSSDKRLKPNVSAYGHAIVGTGTGYLEEAGTSFSSPLVAGFAACVMQLHPDWKNMQVYDEISKSADLYPYFDYAHGYGVPQASYFTDTTKIIADTTFRVAEKDGRIIVTIDTLHFTFAEPGQAMYFTPGRGKTKEEIEEKWRSHHLSDQDYSSASAYTYTTVPDYVFYHIENHDGYLDHYYVVSVNQCEVLNLDRNHFTRDDVLRIFYKGFVYTMKF